MTGTDHSRFGQVKKPSSRISLSELTARPKDRDSVHDQAPHADQDLLTEMRQLRDDLEGKNRELARNHRLAELGQMATHAAHKVLNNLMPVTLYSSLLERRIPDDPEAREMVERIQLGLAALDDTVNDLIHFTSDRKPRWTSFSAGALLDEVCNHLSPQISAHGIRIQIDIDPRDQTILADRLMLQRALINLVLNAVDAMPAGGELVITAIGTDTGVEIEVADSGPGISDQLRDQVFEPFFTTKGIGMGLGLSIVDRIAELHGGVVTAQNCPEGGAAFTLSIPREHASMRAAA